MRLCKEHCHPPGGGGGHCQEDFAVLGDFCAKIITSRL